MVDRATVRLTIEEQDSLLIIYNQEENTQWVVYSFFHDGFVTLGENGSISAFCVSLRVSPTGGVTMVETWEQNNGFAGRICATMLTVGAM